MRKLLSFAFLVLLISLFFYDRYQIANLPPALKLARDTIEQNPQEKKHDISASLLTIYPKGSDKDSVLEALAAAGFVGGITHSTLSGSSEGYFAQADISAGFIGRLTFQYYKVSIQADFQDGKLVDFNAYAFN